MQPAELSKIKVSIPGASPELLTKARQVAEDYFKKVGVTPWEAAHASWRVDSFFDIGEWLLEEAGDEIPAAAAWEQVDHVVAEACGVRFALVELDLSSEQSS